MITPKTQRIVEKLESNLFSLSSAAACEVTQRIAWEMAKGKKLTEREKKDIKELSRKLGIAFKGVLETLKPA